ncbi:glycine--tRNA ligase subunit beta [Oceanicoccus sp. KOV_DT_Chl]|uniref:glycine--tRNA ligase subunit beta n=1 Tax=Oceanicoccus sp. KOV_DT_Chl TaxID=1904639 RepID=UPI000C7D3FC3|nr:glycine--tRNA ligase subunit beta [Oceanicoccus sp. KOV_DT_Chl]
MTDFLVEIGTEELPPTALLKLSNSFTEQVEAGIRAAGLEFTHIEPFATPRRLAVVVSQLDEQTAAKEIVNWGPPAAIAFDAEGNPSKAATAFAKKNGIKLEDLTTENDGKADKLVYRSTEAGKAAADLLPAIVQTALDKLPIAKRMRWGASRTEFVRPAKWIVMMQGSKVIDCEILGFKTANITRGHRFHCDTTLEIANPAAYADLLSNSGHIVPSYAQRKTQIREQVMAEGEKLGGVAVIEESLLEEVTGLVEWPVALTGSFEQRFLEVPAEALISSMSEHQKYFHVVDKAGKLMPHFITVANIVSNDPAQVISGNERVIRPRLSDAAFFFETDKKIKLETRLEKLKSVVFQAKLGTIYDKAQRVKALAASIAESIGSNAEYAGRAGELCKADLVSDMVLEFDKMQGIAGRYYALADGEAEEVAEAIKDQYLPKFAGDALPASLTGCAVALADRLDTIVGIFGIGQPPTGSKDPFALRRATLGVLRIIVEKELDLDLRMLISQAQQLHGNLPAADGLVDTVLNYMVERFRAGYEEANIPAEVFMAVSAKGLSQPLDIDHRVKAVNNFNTLPEAQALAAANKRVSNILAKLEDESTIGSVDNSLLVDAAEKALAQLVQAKAEQLQPLFAQRQYQQALAALADLREPVDSFFEDVMVMADDEALKNNRLALLKQLRGLFLEVADISLLVPAK